MKSKIESITTPLGKLVRLRPVAAARNIAAPGSRSQCGFRGALRSLGLASLAWVSAASAQSVPPGTPIYQQLKSFGTPSPGGIPDLSDGGGRSLTGLIQGADGALYGTTTQGGQSGYGTVFKLNPDGTGFTVLQNLDFYTTGIVQSLIMGTDGGMYGTRRVANDSGQGSVFKINPDDTAFIPVHSFGDSEGVLVGLLQGTDGVLYGTTAIAGSSDQGTVFKVNPDGTGFAVIHHFEFGPLGWLIPDGGLLEGTDGALYGTCRRDDSYEYGTLFKLNRDGTAFNVLYNFSDGDAAAGAPWFGLVQGADGALFGAKIGVFKLNTDGTGLTVLQSFFNSTTTGSHPGGSLIKGTDGALYGVNNIGGSNGAGSVFKLNSDGTGFTVIYHFEPYSSDVIHDGKSRLLQGVDGNLYGTTASGGAANAGSVYRIVIGDLRIGALTPGLIAGGSGAFTLSVEGFYFAEGAVVQWNGEDLDTTFLSSFKLNAEVPNTPTTSDLLAAQITVRNPDGTTSSPSLFLVTAANVAQADGSVANAGYSVGASTAPSAAGEIGVSATLTNTDGDPVSLAVANYSSDPSGTAFNAGGGFTDVQVTGADLADTATVSFYYPSTINGATELALSLVVFDGSGWSAVGSDGNTDPVKNTTDNLDGTVSGGRFTVVFSSTSTPKITELGGTFFAMGMPFNFTGFLAPIGGADHATGGSFADPVQTFKAGSTIPVKFKASHEGAAILTGVHTLQAKKYSSQTTAGAPIDATPQGQATSGNRFELKGGEWHFNIDTRITKLTTGIWQLVATLSDGSRHHVWIQIK